MKRGLRPRGFGVRHGEYTSCICGRKCSQYRSHFSPWTHYILRHSQLVTMVTLGYRLGWDKDLALRGLLAPWGGSDMDLAHGGFWPSGEDSVLAHGGWPSGEGGPRSEGIFGSQGRIQSSLSGDSPQGRGDLALRGFLAPRGGFSPHSRGIALRGGPLPI